MTETTPRVLRLLSLLQSRPVWAGPELAERLGVTTRCIRRDVGRLRDLGYPVHAAKGVGGGYRLGAGKELPPLLLDDEEAVAVAVCLRLAAGGSVAGLGEVAVRTLAKLDQLLPARLRAEVDAVAASTVSLEYDGAQVDAQTLVLLARACRARTLVTFDYQDRDGSRTARRVEPHRLVAAGRRWYLMAYDIGRADWRAFRLDRMQEVHATTFRFAEREAPDPADFVRHGLTQAPYEHVARVRVHAPASEVAAQVPSTVGEVTRGTDGASILVAGGNDLTAMAYQLLRLGHDFEVIAPPALRDAARTLGQRLVDASTSPP